MVMAFALLVASLHAAAVTRAQVLERIVATVGPQVITLSDARAAVGLGLLADASSLPLATVVERLVDRELMRAEIDRFGVVAPPSELLTARIEAIRKRFANQPAFDAALEAHGLSDARFRAWVADDWRIEQYIQQRFDAAAQPTDEDVLQYYQSREREFSDESGRPRPYNDVREEVRRRLLSTRRQVLIDDWVSGLKRRSEIVIMPERGA
jgi:hypothetical protein